MSRNTNEKVDSQYYSTEKKSIVIGNYTLEKSIGEGTFGKVHLGTHILTKEKVAVKILEKNKIKDEDSVERVNREIMFLKKLKNENIIKLYEIIESSKSIFLIMEYAPHGELFNYIVKKQRLDEKEASFFFVQIVNGIEFIHSHHISHRDLKPENLLLSENNILKIIDFGLSNSYKNNPLLKTPCGSPCYAAPEMLLGKQYSGQKIDIWSTGIILYAMVNGFLPFEDENNSVLYKKILECNLYFPYQLSDRCLDMINRLLTTNPDKRITLDEIKEHSFYKIGYKYLKKKEINFDNNMLTKHTLEKMINMNFSKSMIFKNLNENHHNNITATFHLIFNSIKYDYYFKNSYSNLNKDNYNSHSHLMKEDRICIFNEGKVKNSKKEISHKHEVCETEINLKDNIPKMVLFEKENIQQNSNRAESTTNERQHTNSTTNYSKKATAGSIKTNSSKNPNNFNKKSGDNKKEDIYLKTEVNTNNNLNQNDDNVIEPFYTVINTTEENEDVKRKKNNQKTFSLNLNPNNHISNLVKTKKLTDNYLSLGIKNDLQGLLKKPKEKIQIDKLFNMKKDEKSVNISSPNNLKKDNKAALELQQQIFNKFSNCEAVQNNNQNKAYSKIKISQNFQNILKDFKSKIAATNVKSPKKLNQATNFSLDKRKKTEQHAKIQRQNTSISKENKKEKPITFSPVSNNIKNKAAQTVKDNNYFIRTTQITTKNLDYKNESMSKEKEITKKNSNQYCTSVLMTETNLKNYRKLENNINNTSTNYNCLLTENYLSSKSKIKPNKTLFSEIKGKNDEVVKNFSPKNVLQSSKQSDSNKKAVFDYKLKPTTIKLSKGTRSSESPSKKRESSMSQDLNYFKVDKLEEIKSKIFKFCRSNNMKIYEVEKNKFECNKNNNTFGIEIVNQTSNPSKLLKVTHLFGKEDITRDVIRKFLTNIEEQA